MRIGLNCNRSLYGRVRLIILYFEIFKLVVKDRGWLSVDLQCWQRKRFTAELKLCLLDVIAVQMNISPSPYEITWLEVTLLREHVRKQCI